MWCLVRVDEQVATGMCGLDCSTWKAGTGSWFYAWQGKQPRRWVVAENCLKFSVELLSSVFLDEAERPELRCSKDRPGGVKFAEDQGSPLKK